MTVVHGTFDTTFSNMRVPVIRALVQPEPIPSLRQLARSVLAKVLPRNRFMVDVPKFDGKACLTFDDGPHPDFTPRILDILKAENVSATFFLIGEEATKYPEIVRRIADEGHVTGNHTWTHQDPAALSGEDLATEIAKTDSLLKELTGACPQLFRPPMGRLTVGKLRRLWQMKKSIVLWSNDPKDFACGSSYELRAKLTQKPIDPGDIVLMHDNKPFSGEVLREVISNAKKRGILFDTPLSWANV